jgi:hypothetical protein
VPPILSSSLNGSCLTPSYLVLHSLHYDTLVAAYDTLVAASCLLYLSPSFLSRSE